jgi:hypothetical protein
MTIVGIVEIWLTLNVVVAAALLTRADPPEHVEASWREG